MRYTIVHSKTDKVSFVETSDCVVSSASDNFEWAIGKSIHDVVVWCSKKYMKVFLDNQGQFVDVFSELRLSVLYGTYVR